MPDLVPELVVPPRPSVPHNKHAVTRCTWFWFVCAHPPRSTGRGAGGGKNRVRARLQPYAHTPRPKISRVKKILGLETIGAPGA